MHFPPAINNMYIKCLSFKAEYLTAVNVACTGEKHIFRQITQNSDSTVLFLSQLPVHNCKSYQLR